MRISTTMIEKILRGAVRIVAPLLFWGGLLWLVALWLDAPVLLPTPPAILRALGKLSVTADFWRTILSSLGRVLGGLIFGVAAGTLLGVLTFLVPKTSILVAPLLTIVRSTPVASFVILVWSFTGSKTLPFVIAALMVLPIVADELSTGLAKADPMLGEVASLYALPPARRFLIHRLPAALPYFFGAVTSSVGFAWKAGIAAEVLAATAGSIGKEIYFSKLFLETDALWAWTLTVVVFSLILEIIVKNTLHYIERRTMR